MLRINNIKLNLDKAKNKKEEKSNLRKLLVSKYRFKNENIIDFKIRRKSVDARKIDYVHFVYNIDLNIKNEEAILKKNKKGISISSEKRYEQVKSGDKALKNRPVIVGFGPSGIFTAYLLAKRGYKPLVLERGLNVVERTKKWNDFLENRKFDEQASILFGEGGAGTFSDGKLTTLINDVRCDYILNIFVENGADEEILYINKPHIGTDVLKKIIKNIREKIIDYGGEIRFDSKVTDLIIENEELKSIVVNDSEKIETSICILGIGHSSRDTFDLIYNKKVILKQKPFSIGVRIEHPQKMINEVQYGKFSNHKSLGAADYKLVYHDESGRTAYTFCMCPGGYVVCSSSEENGVCTNGMSLNKRDNINANSAVLVNVDPDDFPSEHPLAGIEFQRKYEKLAFESAGSDFNAPVQLFKDFLIGSKSTKFGEVIPTYKPDTSFVDLNDILPKFVSNTIKKGILSFDKKIKGFARDDALLTGVETRSSSPVRIVRNEEHETNIKGLFSMGEGAGYAGGIMSSAVDGLKTAEKIIAKYKPF